MLFSSIKGINRLISKGMSNIYLQVTIEKNGRSQNIDFKKFVSCSVSQFLRSSNSRRYHLNFQTSCCNLKIRGLGAKLFGFLLNKNIYFNKNETKSKMENPTYSYRETNLVLQLM